MTATMTPEQAADQASPLDALLIDAALGPVRRFAPDMSTARLLAALAQRPRTPARRLRSLAAESGRIARATSTLAPPHHPRIKWGWYAGGDYGAGAGPDGESDLAFAAVPEHADPETVIARVRALA